MDSGCFYRGGSSITSSLSRSQGHLPLFTSSPNGSYDGHSPYTPRPQATVDPYASGHAVNQKLDQLLHLFQEQKTQTAQLEKVVSTLKDEVMEIKKRQDLDLEAKKDGAMSQRKSWKLPPDLSV